MNSKETRDKLRGILLAALMITSVFAGTVAFSGTVAANAGSLSIAQDSVQSDGVITVSGTAGNANNDVSFKLEDTDGDSATVTKNINSTTFSVDIDLGSLNFTGPEGNLSEGSVTVHADENSTYATSQSSDTVMVDDTAPSITDFSASDNGGDPKISISANESLADIAVAVVENDGSTTTLTEDNFTLSGGAYTATLDHGDGFYKATLKTAADDAGNDGASGQTASVRIDGATEFSDFTPAPGSAVSNNTTRASVHLGSGYSDIAVSITNSEVVYRGTPDDSGVYYINGDLIIDPAGSDVPNLPDGEVTIGVSATKNGNDDYDEWTFTVDTKGPTFEDATLDGDATGSKVASKSPTFTVNISDTVSSVDPFSVSVTVSHDGKTATYTDSDDGVNFDGTTLTVDSSGSDVMDFTQGKVSYVVSAKDTKGNYNESRPFSFTVDTINPTVEDVSIENTPVNASNVGASRNVTITFSEPMDNSVTPEVAVLTENGNIVKGDSLVSAKGDAWSDDNTTWYGEVTLEDTSSDTVANVTVKNAKDLAGLEVNDSQPKAGFVYDTAVPSASTNFSASTLNGTLNLTEQFDITAEDGAAVTYEYNTNATGGYPADDYRTVDSPQRFDTTQLEDGTISLKVTVVDDVGNNDTASGTVLLDNYDPSISSTLSEGDLVYGNVNISKVFTVEHTDGNQVTYEYNDSDNSTFKTLDADSPVYNATTHELDTTQLADGRLALRVSVTDDAGNEVTKTVNVTVNNLDVESFSAEGLNGSDAGTATVTFKTNSNLTSLTVGVNSTDDYFGDSVSKTLSLDDFTRSYNATTGVVTYTATVDARDGHYEADLISAVGEHDQGLVDGGSSTFSIDGEDPHVTDARIVGADNTSTQVRVEFNEPVTASDAHAVIGDDRASSSHLVGDASAPAKGYVVFNVDGHFQTGDSPELNVSDGAFDEKFSVETQNATSASDATVVHTLELNLVDGQNVVSVPAASGGLDLTELDALTENDTVWAYDNGEWTHYTPGDNTSDFTTMEGGQGYIVVMDHNATIDVNVYNQPGGTNVASATPGSEDVNEGWNLLGHWQEGSQSAQTGLSTIGKHDYGAVYQQTRNGKLSFSVATELKPGEGYWVFVTEDDGDAYGETAYATTG